MTHHAVIATATLATMTIADRGRLGPIQVANGMTVTVATARGIPITPRTRVAASFRQQLESHASAGNMYSTELAAAMSATMAPKAVPPIAMVRMTARRMS